MREYFVCIDDASFAAFGCEAAYAAFRKACEFAEILGRMVCLVDGETGEVLADNEEEV